MRGRRDRYPSLDSTAGIAPSGSSVHDRMKEDTTAPWLCGVLVRRSSGGFLNRASRDYAKARITSHLIAESPLLTAHVTHVIVGERSG